MAFKDLRQHLQDLEAAGELTVDSFIKTFSKEYVQGLIRCGGDENRIASGEFAMLVFNCTNGYAVQLKESGAPVDYTIPPDAAMVSPFYMSIPKNAAHPNAAKLYISMFQTKEGQDLIWEVAREGSHLTPGSKYSTTFEKEFAGQTLREFTADYLLQNNDRLDALSTKYRDILAGKQ